MMAAPFTIEIDTSDLDRTIAFVKSRLTPAQFKTVMSRVYRRTGGKIRTIVSKDVPKHYYVTAGDARNETGAPQISGMSCTVPITGPRRTVGVQFKAKGSHHGWNPPRYTVSAKIVRGSETDMEQGTFRNMPSALGGQAYMRFGARLPIKKTLGPAIPEMATHLAEPDIQKDVLETMEKRLLHEMQFIFG